MHTPIGRRAVLQAAAAGPLLAAAPAPSAAAPRNLHADAAWLDGEPPAGAVEGSCWGVAWPRGVLRETTPLTAVTDSGAAIVVQSWTLARWPDGSRKWTGHALAGALAAPTRVRIQPGRPQLPDVPIRVRQSDDAVEIENGPLRWRIARSGTALLAATGEGGTALVGPVELVAELRTGAPDGPRQALHGHIDGIIVEQQGPVRAVVRIDGRHIADGEAGLPFTIRVECFAGSQGVRIVHSFIHDLDPDTQFLSAIGLRAAVPMRGAAHDRHVRLATGADTMFAEAVRPLTGLRRDPGRAFRTAQVEGRAVPPVAQMRAPVAALLDRIPAWDAFSLRQCSANGFTLAKRTAADMAWVDAGEGRRAPGLAYVGTPQGGAAIAARWFWQRHPSELAIEDATRDAARLTAWLWSPNAPPMDLRRYHGAMGMESHAAQNQGLDITYEDYEPGWDSPKGIARTSELMLWAFPATPPTARLQALANATAEPPRLMADPAQLHAAGIFGDWGLPDRSTPVRVAIEDQLERLIDFYAGEVDRRGWYGFWNHGDVMHSYDADRHQWRYDIGGFAWANSELSPDLWLWYSALRSRSPQAFRLAEAMTRHTSEVDVYHLGRFAGLGTRHGVQHWSDSSKQPRVSNANYRRIFHYLTADERTGDLMRALASSHEALRTVEIGRKVPGAVRETLPAGVIEMTFGTTWAVLAGAWLTEWERTGDARWRDRIVAGMDSIGRLPRGWLTGSAPYDLASGRFLDRGAKIQLSHLNAVFGAVEINAELLRLLDVPRYRAAWLDYCRWYNAPKPEWLAKWGEPFGPRNLREAHSRLTATAAHAAGDAALAARAAAEFLSGDAGLGLSLADPRRALPGGGVEWPGISTNAASQWGLAAIQNLALIPAALDHGPLRTPATGNDATA
ncbi:Tat pathway signal sequence domain protein [Sphingomonas sp. R1]|uniref:exo-rhamnogalacturonan lyase family protein n=1 Tax=Sphingomonas sp. R1 TaxID=399176 RepID=UPI002224E5D4|nr:Tat pathway signal sequence domain protein [Sphingomonas sp. R1]UYY79443.1 Tat pathway signal sequence domain protein [Sphingomonas sp. R1]